MSIKSDKALTLWSGVNARCPLCAGALTVKDGGLSCGKKHHFDLSRQGAVQLLAGHGNGDTYDRALFTARRQMLELGLFTPAARAVLPILEKTKPGLWLDAGCGEGWITTWLDKQLPEHTALGLDLAPEGIRMAAASWGGEILWTVGDLAHIPLQDGAVTAVLNFLTPAHYSEFFRVLGSDGLLIKVIPGAEHLCQLREAAGVEPASDSRAREFFEKNCEMLGMQRVTADIIVEKEALPAAAAMAPFAQHRREKALEALRSQNELTLTADLILLWGRVKEKRQGEELE